MEISIVVPVYNVIKNAVEHLPSVIQALRRKYKDFELLFIIDNVGVDKQIQDLMALKQVYNEINTHQLNKNYGQHFATLCGYYLAKGDFIICVDEDMSKYIAEICNTNEYKKYDVFYFHYNKNDMYNSSVRKIFSTTYKIVINKIVNLKKHSTFRIISNELRNRILLDNHIFWNLDVMIFNNTQNIGSAYLHLPDITDKDTNYNFKKLSLIAFEIAYEHNPIFMNFIFGFLFSILVFLFTKNYLVALSFFVMFFLISSFVFTFIKSRTENTSEKILKALK